MRARVNLRERTLLPISNHDYYFFCHAGSKSRLRYVTAGEMRCKCHYHLLYLFFAKFHLQPWQIMMMIFLFALRVCRMRELEILKTHSSKARGGWTSLGWRKKVKIANKWVINVTSISRDKDDYPISHRHPRLIIRLNKLVIEFAKIEKVCFVWLKIGFWFHLFSSYLSKKRCHNFISIKITFLKLKIF